MLPPATHLAEITYKDIIPIHGSRSGYVKCRLVHFLNNRSFVQPDILFGSRTKEFYLPRFFDPNRNGYFGDASSDFCKFPMVVGNHIAVWVAFFERDKIKTCFDGSVIYRCRFSKYDGEGDLPPDGKWRRHDSEFQLRLYHHTNEAGLAGIRSSRSVWSSRRNIQGDKWLLNGAYGYFTTLPRIRDEADLLDIAMSSSGLTGLIPTNAPYHPRYASFVQIPTQSAAQRSRTVTVWIDSEYLAPNHLWLHIPMDEPAYYEVVLPKVLRVGVQPGTDMTLDGNLLRVASERRRVFRYIIVGNADTHEGLTAPYHEEETSSIAAVENIGVDDDIIAFWRRNANTNLFDGREIEHAELRALS